MIGYRIIVALIAPIFAVMLGLRLIRGRERFSDIQQRLGGGAGQAGAIWVHGASNGELTSARGLIEAVLAAFPHRDLVVTANTTTGRALVEGWQLKRVQARLAPVDLLWVLGRFYRRWSPVALISLENEIWPNRMVSLRAPVLCVGARLSRTSASRWRRVANVARAVTARIGWLFPQDAQSGERFVALGLPPERLGAVVALKPGVTMAAPAAEVLAEQQAQFARADTVLAASTHAGEDAIVLEAFGRARQSWPELKLIIAPRHPGRSGEIRQLIAASGFSCAVRSKGETMRGDADFYLADTLGEMALWYSVAGVCFVGGSLVAKGGHTPYEPAQCGSAILHGPHLENFAGVYRDLHQAGAAVQVTDAASLAQAMLDLRGAAQQRELAEKARAVLAGQTPDLAAIVDVLTRLIAAKPL